jgi:hypothetical protein
LARLSSRLRRANPIGQGIAELHRHYAGLENDCDLFLAEAQEFAKAWKGRGLREELPGG